MTTATQDLFTSYVQSVNHIFEANQDTAVVGSLIKAGEKVFGGKSINFAIVESGGKPPADYFTTHFAGKRFHIDEHGKSDEALMTVELSMPYMKQVVDHESEYVESPMKVDWDWLRTSVEERLS